MKTTILAATIVAILAAPAFAGTGNGDPNTGNPHNQTGSSDSVCFQNASANLWCGTGATIPVSDVYGNPSGETTAIGVGSYAAGSQTTAVGYGAISYYASTTIGAIATAYGTNSDHPTSDYVGFGFAGGNASQANGYASTAIAGYMAIANGYASTAIGLHSVTGTANAPGGNGDIAIGSRASTMVASGAQTSGNIAIGSSDGTVAGGGPMGLATTTGATSATGGNAIAFGTGAVASGKQAVSIGSDTSAPGWYDVVLGSGSKTTGNYGGTAVGGSDASQGKNNIAGQFGSSFGFAAQAKGVGDVALGAYANTGDVNPAGATNDGANSYRTAVGYKSKATGEASVALGSFNSASGIGSVVLGYGSTDNGQAMVVSVGGNGLTRRITNVTAGVNDTDAANVGQINSAVGGVSTQITNLGNTLNQSITNIGNTVTNNTTNIGQLQTDALQWNYAIGAYDASHGTGSAQTITNVKAGVNDTDAVNMSQLNATNTQVSTNTTNIAQNTSDISTLNTTVGSQGTSITNLQADALQWNAAQGAYDASHGSESPQRIGNVADGSAQHDAVNYGQLQAVQQQAQYAGQGWNFSLNGGEAQHIAPGATIGLSSGKNVELTQDGNTITVATSKDLTGDSFTAGNAVFNGDGVSYKGTSVSLGENGLNNGGNVISNVAAGVAATDAVNKGQMDSAITAVNTSITNVSNTVTGLTNTVNQQGQQITNLGSTVTNLGNSVTAIGNTVTKQGDQIDNLTTATASNTAAIAGNTVQIQALVNGQAGVCTVSAQGGLACSIPGKTAATANGDGALASGNNAVANGTGAIATGTNAVAKTAGSVAIGAGAQANGDPTVAVGNNAVANGNNSVALGANSTANGNNSVALGAGSVASRDNSVDVGGRQITSVAAGTQATDATNLGQVQSMVNGANAYADQVGHATLQQANKYAARGVASAMAVPTMPQLNPGQKWVGAAGASYDGSSAMGIGFGYQVTEQFNLTGGFSKAVGSSDNTGSHIAFKVQAGYAW